MKRKKERNPNLHRTIDLSVPSHKSVVYVGLFRLQTLGSNGQNTKADRHHRRQLFGSHATEVAADCKLHQ